MPRSVHALLATIMAFVAGAAALYLSTWLSVPFINAGDGVLGRGPYAFRVLEFAAFVVAIGIVACPLALVARAHAILYGFLAGIAASALMALMYHGDILSRQYSSFFLVRDRSAIARVPRALDAVGSPAALTTGCSRRHEAARPSRNVRATHDSYRSTNSAS